jgi:hypothetical protein
MRLLLTLMAVAMLTFAIGCAPKDEGGGATDTSTSGAQTSGTETPATTPDTSEMQLVSLKLPGMT